MVHLEMESRLFRRTVAWLFGPTIVQTLVRGSAHTFNFGSAQTEKSKGPDQTRQV